MARRSKGGPGLENHSLILASAESLGRMIGALQRQLDAVAAQPAAVNGTRKKKRPVTAQKQTDRRSTTAKTARTTKTARKTKNKRKG
jgi:hypothetical protein